MPVTTYAEKIFKVPGLKIFDGYKNIFFYFFYIVLLLGPQTKNKQILKLNPLTRFNDFQFKG